MKLDPQWRDILRKAWSVRFGVLLGLLSAAELLLYAIDPERIRENPYLFAATMFVVSIAALIARVTAQKDLSK